MQSHAKMSEICISNCISIHADPSEPTVFEQRLAFDQNTSHRMKHFTFFLFFFFSSSPHTFPFVEIIICIHRNSHASCGITQRVSKPVSTSRSKLTQKTADSLMINRIKSAGCFGINFATDMIISRECYVGNWYRLACPKSLSKLS